MLHLFELFLQGLRRAGEHRFTEIGVFAYVVSMQEVVVA